MIRLPEAPFARKMRLDALDAALGYTGGVLATVDGLARRGYRFRVEGSKVTVEPPDEDGRRAADAMTTVLNRERFRDAAISAIGVLGFIEERE